MGFTIKNIISDQNSRIKDIRALKHRKYREKEGLFLAEGQRLVKEALMHKIKIQTLMIDEESQKACDFIVSQKFMDIYNRSGLKTEMFEIISIPHKLFTGISDTDNPQGILAVAEMKKYTLDDIAGGKNLFVVLDGLNDPGNAGTIIRTAHAAGFSGVVVLMNSVDIYNPKTVRSAMGSLFAIPCCTGVDIRDVAVLFKSLDIRMYVCAASAHVSYLCIDLSKNAAIVIGNEARGVSKKAMDTCDQAVMIPMPGGAESLNASTAAAILIYESVRQNRII